MFIKYPNLFTGVGRNDNVEDVEKFVSLLYGIGEKVVKDIDETRHGIYVIMKHNLEMWPQIHATSFIPQGKTIKLIYGFKQVSVMTLSDL